MIKVGVVLQLRNMWRGGVVYYHNLLQSYQEHQDPEVRLEVFTDQREDIAKFEGDNLRIHKSQALLHGGIWNWPRRRLRWIARQRRGYDSALLRIMELNGIDLLTHISLGAQVSINTLPWQTDFQHKVFPDFFSAEECTGRDHEIANCRLWGNILLSSQAAANAFRKYFPELLSVRTHVLPFSSVASLSVDTLSRTELQALYPVQKPYFFLPNQFWYHKNHRVVVEALRSTPPEIRVICTGLMDDRRNPSYVPERLATVRQLGLEQRFVCLGEIPYRSMISLMRHSLGVVQPSLFEGWSTTVEEAKAIGKRIILSDIDVHLEQSPDRGGYFSPESPEDLAACMVRVYAEFDPEREDCHFEQRSQYKTGVARKFSESFARILKEASC